jgi:hypothetical protein
VAGFIDGIKAGARDGTDAWRSFPAVSPSGLKLAVLPILATPFVSALLLVLAGPYAMAAGFFACGLVGMLMLAYGVHLKALGLAVPSILGVYGRPYFWSFAGVAIVSTAIQVVPVFAALFLFALVAVAGLGAATGGTPEANAVAFAVMAFMPAAIAAAAWLYARLCLSLPATASAGAFSLADGWNASKGRVTHVLTASMVASFPIGLVDAVSKAALPPVVADPLSLLATLVQVVVVSAAISNVWTSLHGGKPGNADQSFGMRHRF